MSAEMDKAIRVRVDGDTDIKEVAKKAGEIEGVVEATVVNDPEDFEYTLEQVGRKLSELENHKDLDCPLRALRSDIEAALGCDLRSAKFDPSQVLVRQG